MRPAAQALPVQVLLELRGRGILGVLVSSREVMGRGAPISHGVLAQVLDQLTQVVPGAVVQFRSDRDGPVPQAANATGT